MGLQPIKTSASGEVPIFQKVHEVAQGGFTLDDSTLTKDNTVMAGTPLGFDEQTRKAKVVKLLTIYENATNVATTYKVYKGHHAKVGDFFGLTVGSAAYAINSIDTSNAAYDSIVLATTLGVALTAKTSVLFESSAGGASAAAYKVTARGLLFHDTIAGYNNPVSAVLRGTVYERRLGGAVDVTTHPAAVKALLTQILYSQSS